MDAGRIFGGGLNSSLVFYSNQGGAGSTGVFSFRNNSTDNRVDFQIDTNAKTATFADPFVLNEGAAPTGSANNDLLWGDSTAHRLKMLNNNGAADVIVGANTSDTLANKTLGSGTVFSAGLYNAAGTSKSSWHIVFDSVTLSGGTATVTLTGSASFSSSTSFSCAANDSTGLNPIKVVNGSGTSVTFSGTNTDVIRYICVGN